MSPYLFTVNCFVPSFWPDTPLRELFPVSALSRLLCLNVLSGFLGARRSGSFVFLVVYFFRSLSFIICFIMFFSPSTLSSYGSLHSNFLM